MKWLSALTALVLVPMITACHDDPASPDSNDGYVGYIYTTSNANSGNSVIALGRKSDGTLRELPSSPYLTHAVGDAADGDFDTQSGVRIVGDFLLVVNAGANPINGSISVFKLNKRDGTLSQVDQNTSTPSMDNADSHGERAVSIASTVVGGSTWIAVGNQYANPHYEKSPAQAVGMVVTTAARNVAVFTLDAVTGLLTFKNVGATFSSGANGGPATVSFSSDGSRLAVSTWGVPHFDTPDADLTLQKPGRLYVYGFAGGALTQTGVYEETGVSGNIGLSWSPNDQLIYMTNFNLHSSKEDHSVTVHNGTTAAKVQNFPTSERNDEVCWTFVSLDKRHLFTASFTSNAVSTFDIGTDSRLSVSLNPNSVVRRLAPPQDTKEMYQTADGFLYVAGAFKTHSVSIFRIATNGALAEESSSPFYVPSSLNRSNMEHAFIGLTGFEK